MRKVIGIHSVKEALKVRSSKELDRIYFKPDWERNPALVNLYKMAEQKSLRPEVVSLRKLDQIYDHHQGVCVFVDADISFSKDNLGKNSVVLVLDSLEDPKNFGAIIRTAWLMGVDGIFIPSRRSVSLTPSVIKSASGGVEHVPIEVRDNLYACMEELKKCGFWVYSLDANSENSLFGEKFDERTALLVGNEESGIRKSLQRISDKSLSIPQKSPEASYNVSVATALVLSEYFRQNK